MRQLFVQVPRGHGERVLALAKRHDGTNVVRMDTYADQESQEFVIVSLSNDQIGPFLDDLESLPVQHTTFAPRSVFPMSPPASDVSERIVDVTARSPIEIWLGGLQSIGSWKSFLGYTVLAGVVVWIGMFTDTIYLLVAAMLLSPFASPAMNTALATARGDWHLLRQSVIRYFGSLAVMVLTTAVLSFLLQQEGTTQTMVNVSSIATAAVLLPLVAGASGALNLVQSERSSLVSGSAVGIMIAASLAPPAGLVGMAAALGNWGMVSNGLFLLLLQLAAINVSGAAVFRLYGLNPVGSRYSRGQSSIFVTSMVVATIVLVGLLAWQFASPRQLQRASLEQRMATEAHTLLQESGLVTPISVEVQFGGPEAGTDALHVIYVQREPGVTATEEEIRQELRERIRDHLDSQNYPVTALFDITVLESVE